DGMERNQAMSAVRLGADDADRLIAPVEVLPAQTIDFAVSPAGVDSDEQPELAVGWQLGQEQNQLIDCQESIAGTIRSAELRNQGARVFMKQPAILGQLQCAAQGTELLADGFTGCALIEPLTNVALHVIEVQLVDIYK